VFICDVTGLPSAPREPMIKIPIETRNVEYRNIVTREDEETGELYDEEVLSVGTEIVKELRVTAKGLAIFEAALKEEGNGKA